MVALCESRDIISSDSGGGRNNDWNSLIQKEVLARDNFSRKFVAGDIHAPVPVYKDVSMDDANWNSQLRSTYADLGKWGPTTFRKNVPHVVAKKEAEDPSVPPTGAPSEVLSEIAFRHARYQLGKPMTDSYKTRKERDVAAVRIVRLLTRAPPSAHANLMHSMCS